MDRLSLILVGLGIILALIGFILGITLSARANRKVEKHQQENPTKRGYMTDQYPAVAGGYGPKWPFWLLVWPGCILLVIAFVRSA